MMTPQEVSSKTFPKAVMGGYAMTEVDDFLDKLTEDYTSLYKDNAALKTKIKLLAEKMEEQRKTEDAFRSLLLSAQKMAEEMIADAESKRDEIVKEAEAHRDAIMGDAEAAARKRIEELRAAVREEEQRLADKKQAVDEAVAAEEYRLERTRAAVASFTTQAKNSYQEQLALLDRLESAMPPAPERPVAPVAEESAESQEEEAPVQEEKAEEPFFAFMAEEEEAGEDEYEEYEDDEEEEEEEEKENFFTTAIPSLGSLKNLLKRKDREAPVYEEDEEEEEYEEEESDVQDDIASVMKQFAQEDQATLFTSEPEDETRVINLDDLQFGRNYNRED